MLAASVTRMAADSQDRSDEGAKLLKTLADSKKEKEFDKLRLARPELVAADPTSLQAELKAFEL